MTVIPERREAKELTAAPIASSLLPGESWQDAVRQEGMPGPCAEPRTCIWKFAEAKSARVCNALQEDRSTGKEP